MYSLKRSRYLCFYSQGTPLANLMILASPSVPMLQSYTSSLSSCLVGIVATSFELKTLSNGTNPLGMIFLFSYNIL